MIEQWNGPDYRAGHVEGDAQHAHVIQLAAALADKRAINSGSTVEIVLRHLIRFVQWHFATEEAVMASCEYPLLEQHRQEHRGCVDRLDHFASELARTGSIDVQDLNLYLSDWLDFHMVQSDRMFLNYTSRPAR